jgi:predicted nucleic acid-binding protein
MKLDSALQGITKVGLDTPVFIYFIESNPDYESLVARVFERIMNGRTLGVASVLVLTEVLVHPFIRGAVGLENEYRDLLTRSNNLELLGVDVTIAEQAARLRARYSIRTPDALHLATALQAGCQAFLTNDPHLQKVVEIPVLLLSELET